MSKKITPTDPAKLTFANIRKFIQGWSRWIVFKLSKNKFVKKVAGDIHLLPIYKQEQFLYRLQVMDIECLSSGHCKICGCGTPELQMADEACEGNCYKEMMNLTDWEAFKKQNNIIV